MICLKTVQAVVVSGCGPHSEVQEKHHEEDLYSPCRDAHGGAVRFCLFRQARSGTVALLPTDIVPRNSGPVKFDLQVGWTGHPNEHGRLAVPWPNCICSAARFPRPEDRGLRSPKLRSSSPEVREGSKGSAATRFGSIRRVWTNL